MIPKDKIIAEILRLSAENGTPPGQKIFKKETGISSYYWNGHYWPRWSAALTEAGLHPNEPNKAIPHAQLIEKYLDLVAEIRSIPTQGELRMKARQDAAFPAPSTFSNRLGRQSELLSKAYSHGLSIAFDAELLNLIKSKIADEPVSEYDEKSLQNGSVYLLQSGSHYKIGRSSEIERRIKQVSIAMPEKVELVHTIQTDDAVGIELYWHRRFSEKRMNGEWFNLSPADVRAFRRRKYQ